MRLANNIIVVLIVVLFVALGVIKCIEDNWKIGIASILLGIVNGMLVS